MSPEPLPVHPLCRLPDGSGLCHFATVCHDERQGVQHRAGLRGRECWAYEMVSRRRPDLLPRVVADEVALEREALQAGL